ncbi:hypothetical protein D3C78_1068270 [compost metagenome]
MQQGVGKGEAAAEIGSIFYEKERILRKVLIGLTKPAACDHVLPSPTFFVL